MECRAQTLVDSWLLPRNDIIVQHTWRQVQNHTFSSDYVATWRRDMWCLGPCVCILSPSLALHGAHCLFWWWGKLPLHDCMHEQTEHSLKTRSQGLRIAPMSSLETILHYFPWQHQWTLQAYPHLLVTIHHSVVQPLWQIQLVMICWHPQFKHIFGSSIQGGSTALKVRVAKKGPNMGD